MRRALLLVGWTGFLSGAVALLAAAGHGSLAAPPPHPGQWSGWLGGRDPLVAAFALLRLGVLATAWYLLAATVLGALARLLRATRLVARIDVLTVPVVRRLLHATVGLGITAAVLSGVTPARPAAWAGEPVTMVDRLPADAPANLSAGPGPDEPHEPHESWTVAAGDHFWSIAERVLRDTLGRAPGDAEIAPYWLTLVEANRAALGDPANPDLIHPGQRFQVPPVPVHGSPDGP